MTTRDVDGSAATAAAGRLRTFEAGADRALERAVDAQADDVVAAVKARARRHRASGRMESQITAKATGSGSTRRVTVHAGGRVAHLITGGTRAHPIRAIHGRALRMAGAASGFAARVRHPGTRADPFFDRGVDDADHDLDQITARLADELAADLAHDLGGR